MDIWNGYYSFAAFFPLIACTGSAHPPAFLQCNAWMFPMIPGRSPVLNTEPHTYMFPDITIDPKSQQSTQPRAQRAFASVGLILNPNISPQELKRFERVLKCYTDFHHYTPPPHESSEGDVASTRAPDSIAASDASYHPGQDSMALAVRPSGPIVPAQPRTEVLHSFITLLSGHLVRNVAASCFPERANLVLLCSCHAEPQAKQTSTESLHSTILIAGQNLVINPPFLSCWILPIASP